MTTSKAGSTEPIADAGAPTTNHRFCLECGYNLHGLSETVCPECGREFDPENPSTFSPGRKPYPLVLNIVNLLAVTHPLIVLVVFYFMMGLAWIKLGHLPRVYLDNPSFFGLDILLMFAMMSYMLMPVSILVGIGTMPYFFETSLSRWQSISLRVVLMVGGWALMYGLTAWDPGACWEWFFD